MACSESEDTETYFTSEIELPDKVTFTEHLAKIVHINCTPCHRPGEAGPFNLITYEDLRRRASTIVEVTQSGFMPPWPANPNYSRFANERFLTDYEKDLFKKWVQDGAEKGDPDKMPAPPTFPEHNVLGEPDLVLNFPIVDIPAGNEDLFLIMKVPYELEKDTFIRLIEFVPGQRDVVHHMNANLIQFEKDLKSDVFDGLPFIETKDMRSRENMHERLGLLHDDGTYPRLTPMVANYLPGVEYYPYPEGIGGYFMSRKGAFYINDMHYGSSPLAVSDSSRFNIYFSDAPPKRPVQEIILGTLGISEIVPPLIIPPDTVMKFTTEATVSIDISLLTINPHMHLLGKSFKAYAITPQNDTIPLIEIPRWDFRWQYFYTFKNMLKIPAGSRVIAEGVYDNTENNPLNPHSPPEIVAERDGSMKTTDEMFQFIVTFVPYVAGDENISLEESAKK